MNYTNQETSKGSWTPVADGDIYCSPKCGRGCTKQEYEDAVNLANILAMRLGSDWTPVVWENLGWHYRVKKQDMSVTEYDGHGGGSIYYVDFRAGGMQFIAHSNDLHDAIGQAIHDARTLASKINSDCDRFYYYDD